MDEEVNSGSGHVVYGTLADLEDDASPSPYEDLNAAMAYGVKRKKRTRNNKKHTHKYKPRKSFRQRSRRRKTLRRKFRK